jgi:hypothetical protein
MTTIDDDELFPVLQDRIETLLPEEYQGCYEDVQPVSMGSAAVRLDRDGKVAWNEMWASFCDLAMAGGPPHKGTLLEPGAREEIDAQPERYRAVVDEICRGVTMVTALPAQSSPIAGWVRVACFNHGMAGWLLRAIVMENVAARADGSALDVPASPHFRIEKEIKNVVTVLAKTCHYWMGHTPLPQQLAIRQLFAAMAEETPLVEPAASIDGASAESERCVAERMTAAIHRETGLHSSAHRYRGWLGIDCPTVRAAIWMMRMMVVNNVLSRREGTVLFVPVNPVQDPDGERTVSVMVRTYRFAAAKGVL